MLSLLFILIMKIEVFHDIIEILQVESGSNIDYYFDQTRKEHSRNR